MTPQGKVSIAAILAVLVPVGLCLLWMALPFGDARTPGTNAVWLLFYIGGPFIGFAFIAHPFAYWRDLEPEVFRLCIWLSAAYWVIYAPTFYLMMMIYAVGAAGGT